MQLTLYSRNWCHLCHDMEEALKPLQKELGFTVDIVDVDLDPKLDEQYGEKVPVLMYKNRELCHYFLDEATVRAVLQEIR